MTTPDIAGLCKRLRTPTLLGAGEGFEPVVVAPSAIRVEAARTIERQAAEIERLRELLRFIRDTPANEFDAVDVANQIGRAHV
jgi:hypothetical protein